MIQNSVLVDYEPQPSTSTLKANTFQSSGISFPQLFPTVLETKSNCMQMLLLKSKTETVLDCKEELSGTGTYVREKAN